MMCDDDDYYLSVNDFRKLWLQKNSAHIVYFQRIFIKYKFGIQAYFDTLCPMIVVFSIQLYSMEDDVENKMKLINKFCNTLNNQYHNNN